MVVLGIVSVIGLVRLRAPLVIVVLPGIVVRLVMIVILVIVVIVVYECSYC